MRKERFRRCERIARDGLRSAALLFARRSTCGAGYKGCTEPGSYSNPSTEFFNSLGQDFGTYLADKVDMKRPASMRAAGQLAGHVTKRASTTLLGGLVNPGEGMFNRRKTRVADVLTKCRSSVCRDSRLGVCH